MTTIDREAAQEAVRSLLRALGEDPEREGLLETPRRVAKAWEEMLEGNGLSPAQALGTTFERDGYDGVVCLTGIAFTSTCEHHLLPFTGTVDVAYLPGERIVGLSKLSRVVRVFARRLQVQERMTQQIASAIEGELAARGVAVVVRGAHSCMSLRGVREHGSQMVTSEMRGMFRSDGSLRAEVMDLLKRRS